MLRVSIRLQMGRRLLLSLSNDFLITEGQKSPRQYFQISIASGMVGYQTAEPLLDGSAVSLDALDCFSSEQSIYQGALMRPCSSYGQRS